MTVSYWQDASDEHTIECDVCVIGAGIVGLYLAKILAGNGKHVVVLEARHVAAGASGRNAGMVLTGTAHYYHEAVQMYGRETARKVWDLTRHNRDIVRGLSQEMNTPWEQSGSLLLALDDTEAEDLERSASAMRDEGIQAQFSYKDPLRRGFTAVVVQPEDGGIHPVKFAQGLAAASGANIIEQSEVFSINDLPDGSVEIKSRRVTVRCGQAALCTNAYTPLLLSYFEGKITPTRGQIYCTEPLGQRLLTHMCYADYGFEYFRQLPDGRLLMGGWRHYFRDAEVGYEDRTTPDLQAGLEGFTARYFPEAKGARITHRWSGTMGFSIDGLPLVGTLPERPNIHFAVGFTGHGLGYGPATAERLAAYMLWGQSLEWLDVKRLDAQPAASSAADAAEADGVSPAPAQASQASGGE